MDKKSVLIRHVELNSTIMYLLFGFLKISCDLNESDDILNLVLSCKTVYKSCNIYFLQRRVMWSNIFNSGQHILNLNRVHKLLYNSNQQMEELLKFPNLKELVFYSSFDQEIKGGKLPSSLTKLSFGYNFNKEIKEEVLPSSLTELTFGYNFNQEIKGEVLPSSLTKLTFGYRFNKEIKGRVLPSSLTKLTFGHNFNKEIKGGILPIKK